LHFFKYYKLFYISDLKAQKEIDFPLSILTPPQRKPNQQANQRQYQKLPFGSAFGSGYGFIRVDVRPHKVKNLLLRLAFDYQVPVRVNPIT
jgi:hypothetical protein